ncbi:MAG: glycosyltransferase, partial [Eubacterium sp.]|nr:glycosyltransferase [Eubacterium sp.]
FSRVVREFPELELVIYGEGSYREELEKERARLGLEEKIKLPGAVDCVADAVQSAKLFVLSSDYEGMPNALLEAMALGIPVISTDCPCGGPAEIIRDGENGFLVSVGKEEELIDAMQKLLRDDELGNRIGNNARQVQQDYSEEQTFEKLYQYLEKVIAE